MLLALQTAITGLLLSTFPALFTGAGAVKIGFANLVWTFDASSADPVAGEPGPDDAVDALVFDPAAPAGPYTLTRPPYPGPKRVYLRTAAGDLAPLTPDELAWDAANAASFTLHPRNGRDLRGFDHLEVHYGVVAAGTQLKTMHQANLTLTAADPAKATQALALALAVLALNRDALRQQAAFSYVAAGYQVAGTLKTLSFVSGSALSASAFGVLISAEVNLKLQRLLGADEGKPIAQILSPGRPIGGRPVDIDPIVQA